MILYSENYMHPKYNGNIEGGVPSKIYNKSSRVFIEFSKRRLKSPDVFRHSVEKPHNTCATQLASFVVFESSKVFLVFE